MCHRGISQALEYFYVAFMDDPDIRGRFDRQNLWKLFKTSYVILHECSHIRYYTRPNLDSSAGIVNPCHRYHKFLIGQEARLTLSLDGHVSRRCLHLRYRDDLWNGDWLCILLNNFLGDFRNGRLHMSLCLRPSISLEKFKLH